MASIQHISTPVVVSHYNVQPVFDIYAGTQDSDLGSVAQQVQKIVNDVKQHLLWAVQLESGVLKKKLVAGSENMTSFPSLFLADDGRAWISHHIKNGFNEKIEC